MTSSLRRPARLGLPTVTVLVLALAGCGDPAEPSPAAPVPTTATSASPSAPAGPVARDLEVPDGTAGSDGLTVRYLADDGTVRTVGVQDFPR